jgi:hypothetical protein
MKRAESEYNSKEVWPLVETYYSSLCCKDEEFEEHMHHIMLRHRVTTGGIMPEEAKDFARQIRRHIEALEATHRKLFERACCQLRTLVLLNLPVHSNEPLCREACRILAHVTVKYGHFRNTWDTLMHTTTGILEAKNLKVIWLSSPLARGKAINRQGFQLADICK